MANSEFCPIVFGADGLSLTAAERSFFADVRPAGYILFARNCSEPQQIKDLISEMKELAGHGSVMVLVDQEGGRVQRLAPPHWKVRPPAADFGAAYRKDPVTALEAIHLNAQVMAGELRELGFNVNCAPVADIHWPGAHDVIGSRAYSDRAEEVVEMARAVCEGHLDAGLLPVIKHIPGHGRAHVDSHASLPVIDASVEELTATDFLPFIELSAMPLAMTAHIVLPAVDASQPVSTSKKAIDEIIRGTFGFDGVLFSDDIGMDALQGSPGERAANCLRAGCDLVLHCNGDMAEKLDLIRAIEGFPATAAAVGRVDKAFTRLMIPKIIDIEASESRINNILCS